eukprot:3381813-Rhodomonas_salina.2
MSGLPLQVNMWTHEIGRHQAANLPLLRSTPLSPSRVLRNSGTDVACGTVQDGVRGAFEARRREGWRHTEKE